MSIAQLGLLMREEPLRHDEVQLILGSGHRHVEQPTLFLDIQDPNDSPFLTLGRMNRRENRIVFVF